MEDILGYDIEEDGWVFEALADVFEKEGIDPATWEADKVKRLFEMITQEGIPAQAEALVRELKATAPRMLREWRGMRSGFERRLLSYWGKSFDLLQMLLVGAFEAGEEFNRKYRDKAAQENDLVFDVLTRLHARGCQIGFEVMALLRAGLASGAHARWRTLHEVAVVAMFIKEHGTETAERYLAHDIVESYKAALKYRQTYERLGYDPLTDEEMENVTRSYEAVCQQFGPDFRGDYGWAAKALGKRNPKFCDIEASIGLDHWRSHYKLASYNVHANAKGITFNLGTLPSREETLLAGPSNYGLADPGNGTAISLHQLTAALLLTHPSFERLIDVTAMGLLVDAIGPAFLKAQFRVEAAEKRYSGG